MLRGLASQKPSSLFHNVLIKAYWSHRLHAYSNSYGRPECGFCFQVFTVSLALALFTLRSQKQFSSKGNAQMWVLTTALVPNLLNQIIIGLPLYVALLLAYIHGNSSPVLHDAKSMCKRHC